MLGLAQRGHIGYAGHLHEENINGLVYMQARYYDTHIGRFLSVDPVMGAPGQLADFNRYAYGRNNPHRYVDPDGRQVFGSAEVAKSRYDREMNVASMASMMTNLELPQNNFRLDGLVAGKPTLTASSTAALGGGIKATKGVVNADSNVSIVTPALGLRASAETSLIRVAYDGNGGMAPSNVRMGIGLDLAAYSLIGGGVTIEYVPPYYFSAGIDVGVGAGTSISLYAVGVDLKENNE
nr:RHS repeat-associated core domain-containing protein [Luteibacter yeojuensis]